jgi:hypothetical protein
MFVLVVFIAVIVFFAVLLLSSYGRRGSDYIGIDTFITSINSNFNVLDYVLLPVVAVFIVTALTRQSTYSRFDWLIAVFIMAIRFVAIIAMSRWQLVHKARWLFFSLLSVVAGIVVCRAVLDTNSPFLRLSGNTIILISWLIASVLIYKLLSQSRFGDLDEYAAYRRNVIRLHKMYRLRYEAELTKAFKVTTVLNRIIFSIMIAEDLNRPILARKLEWFTFKRHQKASTGIMQITAKEYLSNSKSIAIAQEIILGSYNSNKKKKKDEYSLIKAVALDYNGDFYPELVADIYYILKENKPDKL